MRTVTVQVTSLVVAFAHFLLSVFTDGFHTLLFNDCSGFPGFSTTYIIGMSNPVPAVRLGGRKL